MANQKPENIAPAKDAKPAPIDASLPKGDFLISVRQFKQEAQFFFPWKDRVAAAAFVRGQDIWLVFNKKAQPNLQLLSGILPTSIVSVKMLEQPEHTIFVFRTNTKLVPKISKSKDSEEWVMILSNYSALPAFPIVAEVQGEPPLKANIFLPILETAPAIKVKDPITGEIIEIIPVYRGGEGVFPARKFVDVALPETAQGIVLRDLNNKMKVNELRNGLRISGVDAKRMSAGLPKINLQDWMASVQNGKTLFPYSEWQTADFNDFQKRLQKLELEISSSDDKRVSILRTQLAKLLLGEGLYHEAIGQLSQIQEKDPQFFDENRLAALRGAAYFMAEQPEHAGADFAHPALDGVEEIDFWKTAANVLAGSSNEILKYASFDKQFGNLYPPEMRRKLAIICADQSVALGKYNNALRILDQMSANKLLEPVKEYSDYLIGRIYADNNRMPQAKAILGKIIDNSQDNLIVTRSRFVLDSALYRSGEITRADFIKRLDILRFLWRGDQAEISVLNLLGDLAVEEKQYLQALRAWKELINAYTDSGDSINVKLKMADTFQQLFNDGAADSMTPLEALALYYEFNDLTPLGKAGDKMVQNLADRLIKVDLLDRAGELLKAQIDNRLEKQERSVVGNRLALVQLFNREPDNALKTLQTTNYGNNSEEVQTERNHLASLAYSKLGQGEKALDILRDDFSDDAKYIKLDVYWDGQDWKNVAILAEDIFASRKDLTKALDEKQAQALLKLAVAYAFENNVEQLHYLRDYFTPLMADTELLKPFQFITDTNGSLDPDQMDKLSEEVSKIQGFLESYRSKVKKDGLSSAIKN